MTVTTVEQTLEIDATTSVAVSDITLGIDGVTYERSITYYTDALDLANRRPVLTVNIYSTDQTALKLVIPTGVTF